MSFLSRLFSTQPTLADTPRPKPLFIVGLGNPGDKYARTRHNFGWLALDMLHEAWGGNAWRVDKKFQAEISEAAHADRKVFFIKPQTFMNHSGRSVRAILDFYKVSPQDLIVLHDEVDIPFGRIKTTLSSRAAGHNGVKDIIDALGTQDFRRLRLGVGKGDNPQIAISDFVLAPFTPDETVALPALLTEARAKLETEFLR